MDKENLRYSKIGKVSNRSEPAITRMMTDALSRPELLSLAAGFTDNIVMPELLVTEALASLKESEPGHGFLQYGMNAGRPGLRDEVINLLSRYPSETHMQLSTENVVITNGSQQALYISAQLFCDPGDIVLVENPSYFVFLELLKGLGLIALPIPTREEGGNDWDGMASLLKKLEEEGSLERVKFIYLMGVFANPSTRCLSEEDKLELARVLKNLPVSLPVIEDMAYRELYFNQPYPARSLLSIPEWRDLPVLYCGTFTKPFATGMKVGFAVSRNLSWLRNLARIKGHQDFGTTNFNQAIIEQVLMCGQYRTHLLRIQAHYQRKMEILYEALVAGGLLEMGWSMNRPEGGLLLWLRGPDGFSTKIGSSFHQACLDAGVMYVPGELCMAAGEPDNCVRLSYGALEENRLEKAARRFCLAAGQVG